MLASAVFFGPPSYPVAGGADPGINALSGRFLWDVREAGFARQLRKWRNCFQRKCDALCVNLDFFQFDFLGPR